MAMLSTAIYYDLCGEIDILYTSIKDLDRDRNRLIKMMDANKPKPVSAIDYSQERVQNSRHILPLNEIVERLNSIDAKYNYLVDVYEDKEKTRQDIEERLSEYDGIDYKVAQLRMQGLTLEEIADELHYSVDWIKKVSSRLSQNYKKFLVKIDHSTPKVH